MTGVMLRTGVMLEAGAVFQEAKRAPSFRAESRNPCGRAGRSERVSLCGGDKGSQAKDIEAAKRLASEWSE